MFVGLMDDLRGTVARTMLKAQISTTPQTQRGPQRLVYSGPTEPGQGAGPASGGAQRAGRPSVDSTGIAAAARSSTAAPAAAGLASGPDPKRLTTNRGEAAQKASPVTAADGPGRNDPCPCGSGKKYKKCHGRQGA